MAAVQAGLFVLAVVGLVASVVAAFYYLRIVKVIYFDEVVGEPFEPMSFELKAILAVSGLFTMIFIGFGEGLVAAAGAAAKTFF
jgi:NADH-quinone oxidoreductase subunit N